MPRKGSRKVRTGCLTCKVRKVKCDEGKPYCQRCVSTGRKCDGYAPTIRNEVDHYRPLSNFLGTTDESKALQYFCEMAGPFLSGPAEPYFWTDLVMQFCHNEPAVRHCVIAISLLYEDMENRARSGEQLDNSLALQHYNSAIREVKRIGDQPVVLLVCLLFICIEFLQFNKEAAMRHCNHGIAILSTHQGSSSWVMEHLYPVFRRLSAVPFCVGNNSSDFPNLSVLELPVPTSFSTFSEAQAMMDDIFSQSARLSRSGDMYRTGPMRHGEPRPDLITEQARIHSLLNTWNILFQSSNFEVTPMTDITMNFVLLRYDICRICSRTTFSSDETVFDQFINDFRRMVERAGRIHVSNTRTPTFVFEMAFTPLFFFIVLRCRALDVRLDALRLMRILGAPRESLWENSALHAIGRRIIEIEHGVTLDHTGQPSSIPAGPPPDERRIRFFVAEPTASLQIGMNGNTIYGRRVDFFMRTLDDQIYLHSENLTQEESGHVMSERPGILDNIQFQG
ncbi:hypothetical protein FDECE_2602 [Fusarium decemcellulare]|nr:hypothetical protein FDECE_2602 [Fusarium decemcellulare]